MIVAWFATVEGDTWRVFVAEDEQHARTLFREHMSEEAGDFDPDRWELYDTSSFDSEGGLVGKIYPREIDFYLRDADE